MKALAWYIPGLYHVYIITISSPQAGIYLVCASHRDMFLEKSCICILSNAYMHSSSISTSQVYNPSCTRWGLFLAKVTLCSIHQWHITASGNPTTWMQTNILVHTNSYSYNPSDRSRLDFAYGQARLCQNEI